MELVQTETTLTPVFIKLPQPIIMVVQLLSILKLEILASVLNQASLILILLNPAVDFKMVAQK